MALATACSVFPVLLRPTRHSIRSRRAAAGVVEILEEVGDLLQREIGASGAQAIIVTNDPFFGTVTAKLVQIAAKRLRAVYFFPPMTGA